MSQQLPKIALGAWAWGQGPAGGDQVFGNHYEATDFKPVFDKAMELGLNLFDTAAVYGMGASEAILGTFIKDFDRNEVVISTKFTPQIADGSKDAVANMLKGSLERLHTNYIDVYWIHNPADVKKWTPYLPALVKSGLIKSIGVSNHNLEELLEANAILAKEGLRVSAVQNHYSLLNRSSERGGILEFCQQNDITFYSYMVLEQGALTGKYDVAHPFPSGSERAESYNPILPKLEVLIAKMNEIGAKYSATPAQIATAWAIAKGTLPIIGVTKVHQVEDAYHASTIELTATEVSELEEIASKIDVSTVRGWEKDMDK